MALVIGNNKYLNRPLKNAVNDAEVIKSVLQNDLKFDVVFGTDLTKKEFDIKLKEFEEKITPKTKTFFYFSGHGSPLSENDPEVFLQMINHSQTKEPSLVSLYKVYELLKRAKGDTNILCLDACRKYIEPKNIEHVSPDKKNLSFKTIQRASKSEQVDKGYSSDIPPNSIISYAANYKSQARDYVFPSDKHSPYAKYLIKHLADKDVPIQEVFRQVRIGMTKELGLEETGFIEIHSNIYPRLNESPSKIPFSP